MRSHSQIVQLVWASGVFLLTFLGHIITIQMPFQEEIFLPLQERLALGVAGLLLTAALIYGPAVWQKWQPLLRTHPYRCMIFIIILVWGMIVPARAGNLWHDWPMGLLLFCKLASGLWLTIVITAMTKSFYPRDFPTDEGILSGGETWKNLSQIPRATWAPWLCGAIAGVLALGGNLYLWQGLIRIPDEASYWIQGAMLAGGRLWLPVKAWTGAIVSEFSVIDGGKWYGSYPPGWPIFLSLGWLVGLPQIINPILTAFAAGLMFKIVRRHFSSRLAGPAFLMISISPWLIEEGMTYLSHSTALVAFVVGLVFLAVWVDRPSLWNSVGAAAAFGWIILTRQLDAVCLFTALGIWLLFFTHEIEAKSRVILFSALAVSGVFFGGLHLAYNAALTGDPLLFPLKRYYDLKISASFFNYGFGPEIGDLSGYCYALGHTPFEGFWNAWVNVTVINGDFLGWQGGSLVFFWVWLLWGRKNPLERLFLLLASALFIAYFFWWYHGLLTGSRYYFLLWAAALWGTLAGMDCVASLLVQFRGVSLSRARASVKRFVVASVVLVLLFYYPLLIFFYYDDFFGIDRQPWDQISAKVERPAVVFVRSAGFGDFAVPYCLNDVPPEGDLIFALDHGIGENAKLLTAFPDRAVYRAEKIDNEWRLSDYERFVVHH